MDFTFDNIFFLVFGLCLIVFNKKLSHWWAIISHRGLFGAPYNEVGFRILDYIGGSLFFIIGLLGILNVIKN